LKRFLITGTDTGAGKTTFSCALLRAAQQKSLIARAMKPIASGAEMTSSGWQNDDAVQLLAAQNLTVERYTQVNPYCFAEAIAPHLAQQLAAVNVDPQRIRTQFDALAQGAALMLVEGAGGFLSPLATLAGGGFFDHADLAKLLGITDVLLVVGLKLGCINHARLTELAISAAGLRCVGVVLSVLDPDMPALAGNVESLKRVLRAPVLAAFDAREPDSLAGVFEIIMNSAQAAC
jgi:dethiobiotin synthetase